jgi:hypothetical protein
MNKPSIVLILMVSVVVGVGCAKPDWIQQTLVTADVTGVWVGSFGRPGTSFANEIQFELEQQGSKVKGHYRLLLNPASGARTGPIEGTVAGDLFTFRLTAGASEGEMTVSGDEMKGSLKSGGPVQLLLRRIDSSPPPRSQ